MFSQCLLHKLNFELHQSSISSIECKLRFKSLSILFYLAQILAHDEVYLHLAIKLDLKLSVHKDASDVR